jgi:hypothetical protein
LPKAPKSGDPQEKKKRAERTSARAQPDPPNLENFKDDPVKGARSILLLRSNARIDAVLANADFTTGLERLASDAAAEPKAAVALSRFALRPEFSGSAAAAVETASSWPQPSRFEAEHRRLLADALERLRPSWGLPWLANALIAAAGRYPALRRFFASRLILASGGLMGAVDALARVQHGLKPKGPSQQLSLIRELRDCARPARGDANPAAFIEFAQNAMSGASETDDAQLKGELVQLLCEAASADRGLLLDERILGLVTTLDAESGAKLRKGAAKLAEGMRPLPETEPLRENPPLADQASIVKEAAWSDADEALGRALRDMGVLDRSFQRLESVVDGEAADRTRRAKDASNFVLQWVRQAAHQRNIKALNSVGERVQFDPVYHNLDDDAAPGDYVRVVKPSIVRGSDATEVVIIRGDVELD